MKPEFESKRLLGSTRARSKMYEFGVAAEDFIRIRGEPSTLFPLSIGILGEIAASINRSDNDDREAIKADADIRFSAYFFDSYLNAKFDSSLDQYLTLIGAASYYLCGLQGSAKVLARRINGHLDVGAQGIELLLLSLLLDNPSMTVESGHYAEIGNQLIHSLNKFYNTGEGSEDIFNILKGLRRGALNNGTPREVLFADVACAITKRKHINSTWASLPKYSGIELSKWAPAFKKPSFIRELWPSQHLLGEVGIYKGASAVVQMPTSAGKTKSAELIIRSAFLSERTSLAVIVAPYRALCHEIQKELSEAFEGEQVEINVLSDVMQTDFNVEEFLGKLGSKKQILVMTPEKLNYTLRHAPELALSVGLLIYDEGHLFDSVDRGVTYELLLASLKTLVPIGAQVILISAVIMNAGEVNEWLNGSSGKVAAGANLIPTYRTIAFASWKAELGRLEFVNPIDQDEYKYFVPRIIDAHRLELRGQERKPRYFPVKSDSKTIALYLGLRLCSNGGVAIFSGTKSSAIKMCSTIVDAFRRKINVDAPIDFSKKEEIKRLALLHEKNLGLEASLTECANIGIFAHHANVPQGIRIAVESALQEGDARYVICTSTLAQGVNLPIRYLIVTGIYQGEAPIKVRDFHNLIGRAGRSGKHTEGSIIFADAELFDKRGTAENRTRWQTLINLLDPNNSEPCESTLLKICLPLDMKNFTSDISAEELITMYFEEPSQLIKLKSDLNKIAEDSKDYHNKKNSRDIIAELDTRISTLQVMESYFLAHSENLTVGEEARSFEEVIKSTLAYYLADDKQKTLLLSLTKRMLEAIDKLTKDPNKRAVYGKSLYGMQKCIKIEAWLKDNFKQLSNCNEMKEILDVLWSLFDMFIDNRTFLSCTNRTVLLDVAKAWTSGKPYNELKLILDEGNVRIQRGSEPRIEDVVNICDNAFSYDGTLLINAVIEMLSLLKSNESLINSLKELQKSLKYGLPNLQQVILYEMGFSDRVVVQEISSIFGDSPKYFTKLNLKRALKSKRSEAFNIIGPYPRYFHKTLERIVGS